MSTNGNGKGDAPRPLSVDSETFANNWERVFGKKNKVCEYSGLPNMETYDASKRDSNNEREP